ncbi:Gliotoxin thiomethyltransferase GtmA [Exophiala dermatitidis]
MAATSTSPEKQMWEDPKVAKSYASAETITGPYAQRLLERTLAPDIEGDKELEVLDLACGTGIVSAKLMEILSQTATRGVSSPGLNLTCVDFSEAMVELVTSRMNTAGWKNTKAVRADAMDTGLPSAEYTHILMNFGPMIVPDWAAALREMHRMLQPGGTLGLSSWKELGWYADVSAAFAEDPELPAFPAADKMSNLMAVNGHWDDEQWIKETVQGTGFEDVSVESMPHKTTFPNVDDFFPFITGTLGFVAGRYWTKEQKDKYSDRARAVVEKYMRDKYGQGAITWDWVALLTTAKKPA